MAKEKTAPKPDGLTAYCMKTKTKNVPILKAIIDIKKGRYYASGVDEDGNKLITILGKEKAEKFIADGTAKKGEGWIVSKKK